MLELGIALLLAAAGASATPVAPPPQIMKGPLRTKAMAVFDLRQLADARSAVTATRDRGAAAFSRSAASRDLEDYRIATLVSVDREGRYTGRRVRKSAMAAGVSLRMTNDDGVLASEIGMAGAVGKAFGRMALEAMTSD